MACSARTRTRAQVQRIRCVVPGRGRQRARRRDPAPAARPAPGTDDPRAAPPLRQSVLAAAGAVLADREELEEPRRPRAEIRSARAGARECASADHRGRLEVGLADGDCSTRCWRLISTASRLPAPTCFSSPIRPSASAWRCTSLRPTPASTAACRGGPGRVEVTWLVEAHRPQGLTLVLDWKEREGPAPKRQPARRLRLAAHHHGDRAPAQRRGAADLRAGGARRAADRAAHPRALAGARRAAARPPSTSRLIGASTPRSRG